MRRLPSRLLWAVSLCAAVVQSASAEAPFFSGTFEEACRVAKEKNKSVMIDFYTTWCGPCKMLDRYTWPDAGVKQWLEAHTIPMKVDAERNRELAARYKIRSYPTMVFLNANGVELARTVGFQQPKTFLANAANIIKSQQPAVEPKTANAAKPATPPIDTGASRLLDRMKQARELAAAHKHAEALAEFLWCFDQGAAEGQGYTRLRLGTLLKEIVALGAHYPPALDELKRRRDLLEQAIRTGGEMDQVAAARNVVDFSAINRELGESDKTFAIFELLGGRGAAGQALQQAMFNDVLDYLLQAKRYDDIVNSAGDVFARTDEKIKQYESAISSRSSMNQRAKDNLAVYLRQQVTIDAGKFYESLLGVGRINEAQDLAGRVVKFDNSSMAYRTLIGHAMRAKAFEAAKELVEQAEKSLPNGDLATIRKAANSLPQS